MDNERLARYWMILAGVALVAGGLIGYIPDNTIASNDPDAILQVNSLHNIIHIATGLLALAIAFGTRGMNLANGTIAFGLLYAVVAVVLIVDPTLFGLFDDAPANTADHVLHGALAIVSIAVGYLARERVEVVAR